MNTIITPTFVTKDSAIHFKNHLRLIGNFDRSYDDLFANNNDESDKRGYTVWVRKEQRWMVYEGQQLVIQPILNQTTPITVNHQFHTGMGWSSADDRMLVEEVQSRYTKPAGRQMANKWDVVAGAEVYKQVYHSIGTPGSPITSNELYTDAVAKMRALGIPDEFVAVLDPKSGSKLLAANAAYFGNRDKHDRDYREGSFSGPALGIDDWDWDPNLPTHTTGTFTSSTPVVAGANQTGSTLAISGMGTYALKAGDVFTIDGVYALNSLSYADTGELQQFVLQADVAGSSTATLSISPSIVSAVGPLQSVNASPANLAAISFLGSTGTVAATMAATRSKQSIIFNPKAFAFVMVDLPANLPGANSKRVSDRDAGISMRWVEQYAIGTDQLPRRLDTLGGVACVEPAFALRAWS
jgi:hypothetical protein